MKFLSAVSLVVCSHLVVYDAYAYHLCVQYYRCLLSKNFIRLGRWFVQPQDLMSEQRYVTLATINVRMPDLQC